MQAFQWPILSSGTGLSLFLRLVWIDGNSARAAADHVIANAGPVEVVATTLPVILFVYLSAIAGMAARRKMTLLGAAARGAAAVTGAAALYKMWNSFGELKLAGDIALITGAGSGLGRDLALALATQGCHLLLWGRRQGPLEAVAAEVRAEATRSGHPECEVRVDCVDVSVYAEVATGEQRL